MRVVAQDNFNECGICCVNMLINYFRDEDKNLKPQLLDNCLLTKNGLNLLELELLCEKYKISIDSYEMSYEELMKCKPKNPMILVLKRNNYYHYVVGIFENKKIKIYDPSNQVYTVNSKNDFSEWTGYVCFSKVTKFRFKPIDICLPLLKNISAVVVISFLFLNIFEFMFQLGMSWLMSKIVNLNFDTINNDSLWKIAFIFLIIIFVHGCFTFLNKYCKTIYLRKNFKYFTNSFFQLLVNKNYYFFECYNKQKILQFWNFYQKLFNFYSFYWSDLISQVVLMICSGIVLLLINNDLWIMLVIIITIQTVIVFLKLKNDLVFQNYTILHQVGAESKLHNLLDQKTNNFFIDYELKEIQNLNEYLFDLKQFEVQTEVKTYFLDLITQVFEMIFTFALLIYIWKNDNFNIGKLFLTLSVFDMFSSSLHQNIKAIKHFLQIKPIYKLLMNFVSTNNLKTNEGIKLISPKVISWKNLELHNNVLIDIDHLYNHGLIIDLLKCQDYNSTIKINFQTLKNYSQHDLNKKIILINKDFCLSKEDTIDLINLFSDNLTKTKLTVSNSLTNFDFSKLETQSKIILILLFLKKQKDCIICFNNFFNASTHDDNFWAQCLKLLQKINNDNFIISNCVPRQLMDFYEYQI